MDYYKNAWNVFLNSIMILGIMAFGIWGIYAGAWVESGLKSSVYILVGFFCVILGIWGARNSIIRVSINGKTVTIQNLLLRTSSFTVNHMRIFVPLAPVHVQLIINKRMSIPLLQFNAWKKMIQELEKQTGVAIVNKNMKMLGRE